MQTLNEAIQYRKFELMNFKADTIDIEYLNKFIENTENLIDTNQIELIILFYMAKKHTTLNKSIEEVNKITNILKILTSRKKFTMHLDLLFYTIEKSDLDENNLEEFLMNRITNPALFGGKILLKLLKKGSSIEELKEFIHWLTNEELKYILTLAASIRYLKEEKESEKDNVYVYYPFLNKVVNKSKNTYNHPVNSYYLKKINLKLSDAIAQIKRCIFSKQGEIKSQERKINKELRNITLLEQDLHQNRLSLEKIEKYNLDSSLKKFALIELIKQKNITFSKTYTNLKTKEEIKTHKIEDIFNKYNRNFYLLTEEEQSILSTFNPKLLEENLNFITNSSLKFINEIDEAFINIIMLDMDLLKTLDALLFRNKISQYFILKNASRFNHQSINAIESNVNILTILKIDCSNLLDEDILFNLKPKLIEMYTLYGLDLKNIESHQLEFLNDTSFLTLIDQFIEVGEQAQINVLPTIDRDLSQVVLKRTILMQLLKENELDIKNIANKQFYLSDNELDNYTSPNYETYMEENVKELLSSNSNLDILEEIPAEIEFIEDYKLNDQTYIINDDYFSRIKVLRYLKTLIDNGYNDYKEILFQTLIYKYPKYLSIDTIENLRNLSKETPKKQLI